MGCPEIEYKSLLKLYICNSFKNDKNLKLKYADKSLNTMSVENLEEIIKNINSNTPMYNAMMAGVCLEYWQEKASIDQINAIAGMLNDYFKLFNIIVPKH